MAPPEEIILYQYAFSPYARKVTNYMNMRSIPHSTVEQPPMLPRPDVASYGISYRRIPIMSIGRDFYCDTPLILAKLDELFPPSATHPGISAGSGQDKALEYLLQKWSNEVLFMRACKTIPPDFGPMTNPQFLKDRAEIWGDNWQEGKQEGLRADGLQEAHDVLDFLDSLVEDGRPFVLGQQPSTADIHALFLYDWLMESVTGSLPEDLLKAHPKAVAWRNRYNDVTKSAKEKANPPDIEHSAASARILNAGFAEPEGDVDSTDPVVKHLGLKKGTNVVFYPTDNGPGGAKYRDQGDLIKLTPYEAALSTKTQDGAKDIRIHIPRWNFKVEPADSQTNGS